MLTFKEQNTLIQKYAVEYNKSKIIEKQGAKLLFDDLVAESEGVYIDTKNKYTYYYSLQTKIDYILDKLDWDYSNFLKKEFFSLNKYPHWWMCYYSRSTYYRLKKRSMGKFLELLYG